MTIYFLGWYGRRNSGDEAFKEVHRRLFPDQELVWVRDEVKQIIGHKPGDVFVVGAGDVFQDYYLKRLPEGAKFFVYGAGFVRPNFVDTVTALRDRLLGVWLRSERDVKALRASGIEAHYTPDIVFQLRDEILQRPLPELVKASKKTLIFIPSNNHAQNSQRNGNFREFFYGSYLRHEMAAQLDHLAPYYDLVFLPLSFDADDFDMSFINDVFTLMKNRKAVQVVDREIEPLDAARLIASARLVVSMKYHGLVYAMLAGVPFINAGLTRKTLLLCDENQCDELMYHPTPAHRVGFLDVVKRAESGAVAKRFKALSNRLSETATLEGHNFRDAVLAAHGAQEAEAAAEA